MCHVKPSVRLTIALSLLAGVLLFGTVGFMAVARWSFFDALYMTVITISTIGYGEVRPLDTAGRLFTISLIGLGVTSVGYALGAVAEIFIEQQFFRDAVRERRMLNDIKRLAGHVIVCGYGRVGINVAAQLKRMGRSFVVIEQFPPGVRLCQQDGYLVIQGDATQDAVLLRAGVERADAVVTALDSDAANLYITLSCRALRADLFIVARASEEAAEPKLIRAGANRVLCPYSLTGRWLAEMVVKPEIAEIVEFTDHFGTLDLHVEEMTIPAHSPLVGRTVGDATIRAVTGAMIIAHKEHATVIPNPPPETPIVAGGVLLVLGTREQLRRFRTFSEERAPIPAS